MATILKHDLVSAHLLIQQQQKSFLFQIFSFYAVHRPSFAGNKDEDEEELAIQGPLFIILCLQLPLSQLFIITWFMDNQILMSEESVVVEAAAPIIDAISEEIVHTTVQVAEEGSSTVTFFIISVIIMAIVVFLLMKKKSKVNKTEIGLIGERGSGKTQLFIGLCGGKLFETVPSIANNTSQVAINNKNFKICDFFGDNLSKQEILSNIPKYHTIIHLIDGTDSKKLSDAALFLYRLLINKLFQKEPCNLIVFLNKQDEKGFHGKQKLIKRLEDEIETIKYSRKNQPEDNEAEQDFLRNDKSRFDFAKHEIQIITGSAKKDRTRLLSLLQELA